MHYFFTDSELNTSLEHIIKEAKEYLLLVSPYIKLHERIKYLIKGLDDNPKIRIMILFGKNGDDYSKSFHKEDMRFVMDRPNVEVRFNDRLHAKFYANESYSLLTTMNLYDFSQNNNIEAGIFMESSGVIQNALNFIQSNEDTDKAACQYFLKVFNQSKCLFKKEALFDKKMLNLRSEYKGSEVKIDELSTWLSGGGDALIHSTPERRTTTSSMPASKVVAEESVRMGYCIRTGVAIPFNPDRPFCAEAYQSWSRFSNRDYAEKYCHYSGEPSQGETSSRKPILGKNWNLAKKWVG
jgi:hypothetical protein